MPRYEINSWRDGSVLFATEAESLVKAVEAAVKADTCLRYANLYGADLYGANLDRANLIGANLDRANLDRANLVGANLVGANLYGANLYGANLYGANLDRANLDRANLTPIRDDIWAVLCSAPKEVPGLRAALVEGRVDGSTYEGECACLVGTIANIRHCKYDAIPTLKANSNRPAERFFLAIRKGDTPETSQFSKLAVEWVDQWLANMREAGLNLETRDAKEQACMEGMR